MADYGFPKPRHSYVYVPQPYPGQRGRLIYNGPLNPTGAVQPNPAGLGMGMGMGMGMGYAAGMYGVGLGRGYTGCYPYNNYPNNYYYPNNYHHGGLYGYGCGHGHYGRYANYFCPWQSSYYLPAGAYTTSYPYSHGRSTYYTTATTQAPVQQYTYVQAAATPTTLPAVYHTDKYAARLTTREVVEYENRRVATERGAYRPRKIKPADARPDDLFWCRELDGKWCLREYYVIENDCQPGLWQMDAELGFLVFHREPKP